MLTKEQKKSKKRIEKAYKKMLKASKKLNIAIDKFGVIFTPTMSLEGWKQDISDELAEIENEVDEFIAGGMQL